MIRLLFFLVGSACLAYLSRKALKNPQAHGFYRFFAFEGILSLILVNHPYWLKNPFTPVHLLSWFLLFNSIFFVIYSVQMLKKNGGHQNRGEMPENFPFENTKYIVETGIYSLVRHPMYSSLLFLGWGAFLKHISLVSLFLVALVTGFLICAAKIEERENSAFFGLAYSAYCKKTKMFIPWII